MNKVVTINLGGNAYQLEEGGYEALRAYLDTAAARLQGNPDRDEIISDIEGAIADKFRGLLSAQKNVVETREVTAVLKAMGPVEAEGGEAQGATTSGIGAGSGGGQGTSQPTGGPAPRRLYRIQDDAMIAGVCSGLGAYFGVDVTVVRLAFVLVTLLGGAGLVAYLVMAIVVPEARSPEEKSAAAGFPATAAEFIRRAKEGYYNAVKDFPGRQARREWKRQYRREMRGKHWYWHPSWAAGAPWNAPVHPGMAFTLPILTVLQSAATIFCLCTLISLLATGAVLGRSLPANVPVWLAALLLMIGFGLVAGPLSAVRKCYLWGFRRAGFGWSWVNWVDSLIWLVAAVIMITLAIHFLPELSAAVRTLPSVVREAVENIRDWWNQR